MAKVKLTSSAQSDISMIPVTDGQIIALSDEPGLHYDTSIRRTITGMQWGSLEKFITKDLFISGQGFATTTPHSYGIYPTAASATVTDNKTAARIYILGTSAGNPLFCMWFDPIDLTKVSSMTADITGYAGSGSSMLKLGLAIMTQEPKPISWWPSDLHIAKETNRSISAAYHPHEILTLDLNDVSGEYYVGIYLTSPAATYHNFDIHEWKLI